MGNRHGPTMPQGGRGRLGGFRFRHDHSHHRAQAPHHRPDAADQTAAAERYDHRIAARQLLQNLRANRRIAREHAGLGDRMDENAFLAGAVRAW